VLQELREAVAALQTAISDGTLAAEVVSRASKAVEAATHHSTGSKATAAAVVKASALLNSARHRMLLLVQ